MEPDSWLGVEVRHLAALKAVAEEGSFGRAATRLGYTQSAVSQQIATLERLVGERLVERPGGPPAGVDDRGRTVLLRHADAIVSRLGAAHADLASLQSGTAGLASRRHVSERRRAGLAGGDPAVPAADWHATCSCPRATTARWCGRSSAAISISRSPACLCPTALSTRSSSCAIRTCSWFPRDRRRRPDRRGHCPSVGDLDLISYRRCTSSHQVERQRPLLGATPEVGFRSDDNGTMQGSSRPAWAWR